MTNSEYFDKLKLKNELRLIDEVKVKLPDGTFGSIITDRIVGSDGEVEILLEDGNRVKANLKDLVYVDPGITLKDIDEALEARKENERKI
ncbi:MAG: hypothetical protein IKI57_07370 [Clostridia bacterium]|nr:hypothetical protein [Clostridia bacterium]